MLIVIRCLVVYRAGAYSRVKTGVQDSAQIKDQPATQDKNKSGDKLKRRREK
jgi:hypothetical protein